MPVLVYSVLRAVLFLAVTGLLWWVGMRSWLAPALGAVVAWGLSYVLLRQQRDAAALHLAQSARQRAGGRGPGARAREDAAAEDAAVDEAVPDATPADRTGRTGRTGRTDQGVPAEGDPRS